MYLKKILYRYGFFFLCVLLNSCHTLQAYKNCTILAYISNGYIISTNNNVVLGDIKNGFLKINNNVVGYLNNGYVLDLDYDIIGFYNNNSIYCSNDNISKLKLLFNIPLE